MTLPLEFSSSSIIPDKYSFFFAFCFLYFLGVGLAIWRNQKLVSGARCFICLCTLLSFHIMLNDNLVRRFHHLICFTHKFYWCILLIHNEYVSLWMAGTLCGLLYGLFCNGIWHTTVAEISSTLRYFVLTKMNAGIFEVIDTLTFLIWYDSSRFDFILILHLRGFRNGLWSPELRK